MTARHGFANHLAPMLPAKPNRLVSAWFDWYCAHALRKSFRSVNLYLDPGVRWDRFDPNVPRVYVANHVGFWDGLLLNFILGRHRNQPRYCMIEEPQVRKHPFLRRVGGFSIDRENPRSAFESIEYAANLLHCDPPPAVVIFPQGKLCHPDVKPLRCEGGILRILSGAPPDTELVPVALRYELTTEQHPEAYVHFGAARPAREFSHRRDMDRLESTLAGSCDRLRDAARERRRPDRVLLEGARSVHEWRFPRLRPTWMRWPTYSSIPDPPTRVAVR